MKSFKTYLEEGREWHAVDLDGTLAHYTHWKGAGVIGKPIPKMVDRIKKWLENGEKVKIFTARADDPKDVEAIKKWLPTAGLPELEITNKKDKFMLDIWDDRAKQVEKNTGELIGGEEVVEEKLSNVLAAGLLGGASMIPHMTYAADQPHNHKPHTAIVQSAVATDLNQIVKLIAKHEGLIEGQTPFRITSPEMRSWNKIHGFVIDKDKPKPPDRKNFIFLENPEDVPKAIKQQLLNYATNPAKYGLKPNVSLKDALKKFDQSGVAGKLDYLQKNLPNLDINMPLSRFV